MAGKTYVRNSGKLGPMTVHISGRTAKVYSVLGARSYSFEKMPANYDNRCAILRLAVKHYLDEILDACPAVKNIKEQTPASRLLGFFLSRPQLPNASGIQEMLCCEVYKNYKKYDWEKLDGFVECKCAEKAAEALQQPPVAAFAGFDEEFLDDGDYSRVTGRAVDRLRTDPCICTAEDARECIGNFVSGEVAFYLKITEYKRFFGSARCSQGFEYFYRIVDLHESLLESYISRFGKAFTDHLSVEQRNELKSAGIVSEQDAQAGHKPAFGMLTFSIFSELLLEKFDIFMPYRDFMGWYDSVIESSSSSIELRDCFTTIIQKITGYSQIVKSFLKHDCSDCVKTLYIRFTRFNQFLNRVAETAYLEHEKDKLLKQCRGLKNRAELEAVPLLASIVNLRHGTDTVTAYIFRREIYFFTGLQEYITHLSLDIADVCIFDKKLFFFLSAGMSRGRLFQAIDHTKLEYGVFHFNNRETASEFRDTFNAIKYEAARHGGVYCSRRPNTYSGILVSRVSAPASSGTLSVFRHSEPVYTAKIEYSDLQIGTVSELTEADILTQINTLQAARNADVENTPDFLLKQRVLMENVSDLKLGGFTVFAYNEDNVSYSSKTEIFRGLADTLCATSPGLSGKVCLSDERRTGTSNHKVTSAPETDRDQFFNSILYEDDILRAYCPGDITEYLSQYILVLHSGGRSAAVIGRQPWQRLATIFGIFLQRNLYAFASPADLFGIERCIERRDFDRILLSVSLRNRSNFENILAAGHAIYEKDPILARLIIRLISPPNTPDGIIENLLFTVKGTHPK